MTALQPRFIEAVVADARAALTMRADPAANSTGLRFAFEVVRMMLVADAYFAQVCYRARVRLYVRRVPILPHLLHRMSMRSAQVCIGNPVLIAPGVYFPHGQVVIDGFTRIHPYVSIRPFVTMGLKEGEPTGPTIGPFTQIGTGAKVIGPVHLGRDVRIGAGAIVITDIPDGATAVGTPARVVRRPEPGPTRPEPDPAETGSPTTVGTSSGGWADQ